MTHPSTPPGPGPIRLIGMYLAARGNMLRFMQRLAARYGDLVHARFAGEDYYLVSHPQHIERVLLAGNKVKRSVPMPMQRALGKGLICSANEHHRRSRVLLQPYFQKQSAQRMGAVILGYAEQQMQPWKDGDVRDIETELVHLTLGVILKIVFGTDFGSRLPEFARSTGLIHQNGHATPGAMLRTLLLFLPVIGRATPLGVAHRHVDETIYGLIRTRRAAGDWDGDDLMSMLLRLQKYGTEEERIIVTDRFIRDESVTMLTAGHETISSALTWTWHLLAQHPQAEQKLHEELEAVLGGREPSVEDLPKLQYTRMVFAESMRLYPPVWAAARRIIEELEVGGYRLPPGSCVYFTQYLVHRDPRFHPDPDRFDPDRFLPGEQAKRPNCSYFPFGDGNRKCIGEGMAWMEGLLLLAALGRRWRFLSVPDHPVIMEPRIALQPKFGMRMRLQQRQPAAQPSQEASETHGAAV